ncbi:MAG: trigger factor [Chlamydiae bacterium]|nr:trigger factor [Chlamydiota bacterium]
MTSAAQEEVLTGQDIQVSVHRKPHCLVELYAKVGPRLIGEARKEAVKTVSREVTLPGFRKGKAPESTILKKYPAEVERELHKTLANVVYAEAQKLANVPLLNRSAQITFDLKSHSEESAEISFSFETEPAIPIVDPKLFVPTPVVKAEVGEKQLEEAIRQMLFFFAEWTLIEHRPIQDGDYIMIDLDTIEDGKPQEVFHHVRFEVSKERMATWMQKLVQGAKSGDMLEGVSEPDDNLSEEEKKEFVPKQVRLSILKAEEAKLPELNDDFAKKVGAQTVEEMRESVAKMLNAQADESAQNALHDQVNEFLASKFPFDLPKSLIQTEREHRLQQMLRDPRFKKRWDEEMSQGEKELLNEKLFEEASRAVRLFYLARSIVHQANLPITHQEVQREAISTMQSHLQREVKPDNIPKEVYALALSKVILAKAEEYVIQNGASELT